MVFQMLHYLSIIIYQTAGNCNKTRLTQSILKGYADVHQYFFYLKKRNNTKMPNKKS